MSIYKVVGIMSGTSLDGVDMAYCIFNLKNKVWKLTMPCVQFIPYSKHLKEKLSNLYKQKKSSIQKANIEYGLYMGKIVSNFIKENDLEVDFVASHGHTVFHRPEKKMTYQLGNGEAISKTCKLPVVYDFRSKDISLGGQGAPLVPIGDKLLFSGYDYCLNLGGIANISYEKQGQRIAFDICPCNIVLNYLSSLMNFEFDKNGNLSKKGKVNSRLLKELNREPYYLKKHPKSLSRQYIEKIIFPIIHKHPVLETDKLATVCEHIAIQISHSIKNKGANVLVTGGGALNKHLISRIKHYCRKAEIIIPTRKLLKFKEALIFAFLGVLRIRGEVNCLRSVTGAKHDCCGGVVAGN